jgi:pyruvate dehydrogenase E2 component (dihydrolipoamide acetyltransferase)
VAVKIIVPKLGMTMQEGTLTEWIAEAAQPVSVGDRLFALATDKIDVEVEAESDGILYQAVAAGATLEPGAVVGWLLADGESGPPDSLAPAAPPTEPHSPAEPHPSTKPESAEDPQSPGEAGPRVTASAAPGAERRFVSPNARRVAAELGVALSAVEGTGPRGRIVSADVRVAARATTTTADGAARPPVSSPLARRDAVRRGIEPAGLTGTGPGGRVRRADVTASSRAETPTAPPAQAHERIIPLTGMRRVIAQRMHASLTEMAQLTHGCEATMDAVIALRGRLKEDLPGTDIPVPSLNDFVLRAAALALREHPLLNARVENDGIHVIGAINVALAVAVPDGLIAPVISDAAGKPVTVLAAETRRLATAARAGKLRLDQLEGSTFTVTSLGSYGVDMFTPIVNPGNVAILGVGRVRDGVAWDGDTPRRTAVMTLSLSFDHRAVDGAPAAEYLRTVRELLARPTRLLV